MEEVEVNTNYKTVDKKIKAVAVPLPEDSWQKMKEVENDPSLRNPNAIGHVFTKETKGKLQVRREDFLLPEEERMFRGMLERHHWESLRLLPTRDRMCRPEDDRVDGDIYGATCTLEPQADTGSKSSHSEVD